MLPLVRPLVAVGCLLLLARSGGWAQATDTLALAHTLTNTKQFGAAADLLAHYEQAHPTSTDAYRLHLQLLYWQH